MDKILSSCAQDETAVELWKDRIKLEARCSDLPAVVEIFSRSISPPPSSPLLADLITSFLLLVRNIYGVSSRSKACSLVLSRPLATSVRRSGDEEREKEGEKGGRRQEGEGEGGRGRAEGEGGRAREEKASTRGGEEEMMIELEEAGGTSDTDGEEGGKWGGGTFRGVEGRRRGGEEVGGGAQEKRG
eukprot:747131-Hanusia_phi.AAC.2